MQPKYQESMHNFAEIPRNNNNFGKQEILLTNQFMLKAITDKLA